MTNNTLLQDLGVRLFMRKKIKGGSQLAPLPTTCCGATNHSHGQFLNQLLAL